MLGFTKEEMAKIGAAVDKLESLLERFVVAHERMADSLERGEVDVIVTATGKRLGVPRGPLDLEVPAQGGGRAPRGTKS